MSYDPIVVDEFGGLNLRDDPNRVTLNGCIDMLNVDLDQPGAVRTRNGTLEFTVASATGELLQLKPYSPTQLLGLRHEDTTHLALDSFDAGGTRTAIGAAFAGTDTVTVGEADATLVVIGVEPAGATTEATLAFMCGLGATMRKYNGAALSASVGSPRYLAVQSSDNRLVQAGFATAASSPTGADGSPSSVFFSDPGAPETFGANNFVHLQPGDGEAIVGMVAWREMVFVFKQSTVFVFYGTSTDETGNPVFNYRPMDLPEQVGVTFTTRSAVAGEDGVYFVTGKGIYRTAGDIPQLVSDVVPGLNPVRVSYGSGRLYMRPLNGTYTYVFDTRHGYWLKWQFAPGSVMDVAFFNGTQFSILGTSRIYFYVPAVAGQDNGALYSSSYQSGYGDLGVDTQKVIREAVLTGTVTGTGVKVGLWADATSPASTDTVTVAVTGAYVRRATRGRRFGFKVESGSAGDKWTIERVALHARDARAT